MLLLQNNLLNLYNVIVCCKNYRGYFVIKKLVWNVCIKTFWYKFSLKINNQRLKTTKRITWQMWLKMIRLSLYKIYIMLQICYCNMEYLLLKWYERGFCIFLNTTPVKIIKCLYNEKNNTTIRHVYKIIKINIFWKSL